MKKQKGITLVSLVITVVVLLILSTVAIYSGKNIIQSSGFTAFTTELKIMQTQINAIYENRDETKTYGEEIIGDIKTRADFVFTSDESGITSQEGYRYWSIETIKSLGIEGVEQSFFVNLEKRSIVSYEGFYYEEKTYYTLEQLPDGLYNIEYEQNVGKPTFEVNTEKISTDKWRITVSNIQYDGYIDKWQVCYRAEDKSYWNTTEDLSFVVNSKGEYKIKLQNNSVVSQEQSIVVGVIPGKIVMCNNEEYTSGDDTAIIPVGFMIVPGCEDISEGLVISDNPNDTEENSDKSKHVAQGNQFVWIPVTESSYVRNRNYADTEVSSKAYTDNNYLPDTIQAKIQTNIDKAVAIDTKTKEEVIGEINEQAEKEAVVPKGGFYIARYEASEGQNSKPESKKSATVWNNILQETAKTNAKTFINNNNVKSALISGIQWDATMAFISKEKRTDGNGKTFDVETVLTEEGFSRHTGSTADSGVNEADKVCNIYDLEGNYLEYIAEKNTSSIYDQNVRRGGNYNNNYRSFLPISHKGSSQ